MDYSQQDLQQGDRLKKQAEETPSTFGTLDGATEQSQSPSFGKPRMAGQVMARQMQLMVNPEEQQRTAQWMNRFQMSNEGMQFNQARMMMANPQPQQEQQ